MSAGTYIGNEPPAPPVYGTSDIVGDHPSSRGSDTNYCCQNGPTAAVRSPQTPPERRKRKVDTVVVFPVHELRRDNGFFLSSNSTPQRLQQWLRRLYTRAGARARTHTSHSFAATICTLRSRPRGAPTGAAHGELQRNARNPPARLANSLD